MTQAILNFLSTRLGAILAPVVAAGVASLVAWLGTHVPWIKPLLTDQNIAGIIAGTIAIIMALVNYLTTARGFKYGQQVQHALNIIGDRFGVRTPPDGVVGPQTAETADVVAASVVQERKNQAVPIEPSTARVSNPNGKG